ncbi:MAG: transporter substrate-binding domain-containing protein [Pseudomonadota bacterium]
MVQSNICAKQITVAFVGVSTKDNSFVIATKITDEIARRMDEKIELISLPPDRAIALLKRGKIQAEFARIRAYQDKVPNSIRVKESLGAYPIFAYSINDKIVIDGWSSLKAYKLVTNRGFLFTKDKLKGKRINLIDSKLAAFKSLILKRAEIYIDLGINTEQYLLLPEIKQAKIKKLLPAIDFIKVYPFFAPQYPELAKRYEQALKSMKADGSFARIMKSK